MTAVRRNTVVEAAKTPCVLRDAPPWGAPQDEEHLLVVSKTCLILRKPRSGRLEGRTVPIQPIVHSQTTEMSGASARFMPTT